MPVAAAAAPATASEPLSLLAADRRRARIDVVPIALLDRRRRGMVATSPRPTIVRRAEHSAHGPLILEARREASSVALEVWGPPAAPGATRAWALAAAAGWAGLADDLSGFAEAVDPHPLLRRLRRELGEVRLSALPRLGEAFGRAVLGQLVQAVEADRSTAQLAAQLGCLAPGGLWCWPTPEQLRAAPSWSLRRCGVSERSARALHAGATYDVRLEQARGDWTLLDRRLRLLPGVGAWTSGETRLALGDPDAVPVGDYWLPTMVGHVLGGADPADCDDALMLDLLSPFAGHRGRVLQLLRRAVGRRLVDGPRRRAPRAALSAHRYW